MLCKGIIEGKISNYKFKVRIPSLHKILKAVGASVNQSIPTAIVTISPGVYPALKTGDVVLVGFEDGDIDKPIIVGLLFSENSLNTFSDIFSSSLNVKVNATLPEDTTIGEVSSANIKQLRGVNINLQTQLDNINTRIDDIYSNGCGELKLLLQNLDNKLNKWL